MQPGQPPSWAQRLRVQLPPSHVETQRRKTSRDPWLGCHLGQRAPRVNISRRKEPDSSAGNAASSASGCPALPPRPGWEAVRNPSLGRTARASGSRRIPATQPRTDSAGGERERQRERQRLSEASHVHRRRGRSGRRNYVWGAPTADTIRNGTVRARRTPLERDRCAGRPRGGSRVLPVTGFIAGGQAAAPASTRPSSKGRTSTCDILGGRCFNT